MSKYARIFILVTFFVLGVSFLAAPAVLIHEFWNAGWLDLLTYHNYLFVFFPTLGIAALIAFYLPSCVCVDLYWNKRPDTRVHFLCLVCLMGVGSYIFATKLLSNSSRAIWELSADVLKNDKGEPPQCAEGSGTCDRMPLLVAVQNLRKVSQNRLGLSEFARSCESDPYVEQAITARPKRFCFASAPLSAAPILQSDYECCLARGRFASAVRNYYNDKANRSLTAHVHLLTLPLKVFSLLALLTIGIVLSISHIEIAGYYKDKVRSIDLGLLIGTVAILFFPLMSQAFRESVEALAVSPGTFSLIVPALTISFGAWTLLIGLYFIRRHKRDLEWFGRIGGAIVGIVTLIKYDYLTSLLVRLIGSGASLFSIVALSVITVAVSIFMIRTNRASNS